MVKIPKGNSGENTDNSENIKTIKCGLKSVLRNDFETEDDESFELVEFALRWIGSKSIQHTRLYHFASLQLLHRVNSNYDAANWAYFDKTEQEANTEIKNCFKSVLRQNIDRFDMPLEFGQLCAQYSDELPELIQDNPFNYAWNQYATNVKTNLKTHMKKRIRKYLRIRLAEVNQQNPGMNLTDNDIKHTIDYVVTGYYNRNWQIARTDVLANELYFIGAPTDRTLRDYIEHDWFQSIPMWTEMQRAFEEDNIRRRLAGERKGKKNKSNFTVVPLSSFQRKFIQVDTREVYNILNNAGKLPRNYEKSKRGAQMSVKEFYEHEDEQWSRLFNMDTIWKLARNKHQFRFHFLSDGESVCLHYDAPLRQPETQQLELIRQEYFDELFDDEIGIDPGMNMKTAIVRRDIRTGAEVIVFINTYFISTDLIVFGSYTTFDCSAYDSKFV